MTHNLTADSLALFRELADCAPHWSGTPMIDITNEQRGNLTQIKRAGLLTTFNSDGCLFADFTNAGKTLAADLGHQID